MKQSVSLIVVCTFYVSLATANSFNSANTDISLAKAIVDVVYSSLVDQTTTLDIRSLCVNRENQIIQNDILDQVTSRLNGDISYSISTQEVDHDSASKYILILIDEYESPRYVRLLIISLQIFNKIQYLLTVSWRSKEPMTMSTSS